MENHQSSSVADGAGGLRVGPLESLQKYTAPAFTLAGASLVVSLFAPLGLGSVTEWSWLSGIVLVGLGVFSAAVALLGLYPEGREHAPILAVGGAISSAVAGVAGLAVLVSSGLTIAAVSTSSVEFAVGMRSFSILAIAMAAGYAIGFLSFGIVSIRYGDPPGRTGHLLATGGILVLGLVGGGLLQLGFGIGLPPWILFPVLGVVAIDTLAVGVSLRPERRDTGGSAP